jgi:AraC-like DNA-binding protein
MVLLGDSLIIEDPRRPSDARPVQAFVAGMFDSYVVSVMSGVSAGVHIELEPLAARRLLGRPLSELADQVVPLDDLGSPWSVRLAHHVAQAPDWPARFDAAERLLEDRLGSTPDGTDQRVAWAWGRLAGSHGRLKATDLATELGWSRRHLAARFRDQVGLPPKPVARILRAQHALALADQGRDSWAEIAARAGYADQSHLIRDVRRLTGRTPSHIRPRPDVAAAAMLDT